jgi:hypothetical protein
MNSGVHFTTPDIHDAIKVAREMTAKYGEPYWMERKGANGKGAHEWPFVANPNHPGEPMLACPKCGKSKISMTTAYGPGGRLGDPGAHDIIRCFDCGYQDMKRAKPIR